MGDLSFLIPKIVERLIKEASPNKLILFGSYARGTQHADSDLDILVIEKTVSSKHLEIVRLRRSLRDFPFPIDLLVVSEDEFSERSKFPPNIYYWARLEGRVLYESA